MNEEYGNNGALYYRVFNAMFAQMSATKGVKKFGEVRVAVVVKEVTQLTNGANPSKHQPVVEPIDPDTLSDEDKTKALDAVNMIEEKRDSCVKGQTCANGSKQRSYLSYRETVQSPMISLE